MQRRHFLTQAVAAGGALAAAGAGNAAEAATGARGVFELRAYHLRPGRRERLDAYLQQALLPSLARAGVGPIGVFDEQSDSGAPVVWVLIPHRDAAGPVTLPAHLTDDVEYRAAASELLSGPVEQAVCDHMATSVLRGIESMPGLEAPERKPRLFNLRIYESFNAATLRKKIEMFNVGELAIFRRVGLTPVLFTETVIGSPLPSLTYLLVFDDDAARNAAWQRFRGDPEWLTLKAIPEYADRVIVSRITNKLLTPTAYSQL